MTLDMARGAAVTGMEVTTAIAIVVARIAEDPIAMIVTEIEIEVVAKGETSSFRGWWRPDPEGPTEDLPGTIAEKMEDPSAD